MIKIFGFITLSLCGVMFDAEMWRVIWQRVGDVCYTGWNRAPTSRAHITLKLAVTTAETCW